MSTWGLVNPAECLDLQAALERAGLPWQHCPALSNEVAKHSIVAVGAMVRLTDSDGAALDPLVEVAHGLGPALEAGSMVLLFGRLPPSATRAFFHPSLLRKRPESAGPIHVAHVTRRSGEAWLIGGIDELSTDIAERLMSALGAVVRLPSCEATETASLLEGVLRTVTGSMIGGLRSSLATLEWPLADLLPRNLLPCEAEDPNESRELRLLAWGLRRLGVGIPLVDEAIRARRDRAHRIAERIANAFNQFGRPLRGNVVEIAVSQSGWETGMVVELRYLLEASGANARRVMDSIPCGESASPPDALVILDHPNGDLESRLRAASIIVDCCGAASRLRCHPAIIEA